ncbi:MAG: RNA polymerase sigma factor [Saprospiraceae bacterium]|nr:RNA polymerase sigma factor [Saprospiraceae bacterium]
MTRDTTTSTFASEFNALSTYLRSFALKLTQDVHRAEDLYQDTAFRAFKHQDKFTSNSNLKAWLSTIMKNTFINNFRVRKRQANVFDDTPDNYLLNSEANEIPNDGEGKLALDDLHQLIDQLDERYKYPFLMMYEGYKYDEICTELDLPIGTVKSRIFLARAALKHQIKRLYHEPAMLN